jgi:transposase InsO family protein
MTWRSAMSAREAFIFDVNDGMSVSEAAEEHGVARSCAYKWVGRYERLGRAGLEELSRRPELSPERTSQELVDALLRLKKKYPAFGPAKLVPMLDERLGTHVMAVSTAGQILARHGLVGKRRPRQRSPGRIEHSPYEVAGAGDSMTADYKGQFRMGNGALCYPLTIADPFSRYVLAIDAMASTHMQAAKAAFERVFREHGVPRQLITDNGTPFCSSSSLGGLTQLSRWWIELGIVPIRIEPGRPDQNGIHERMHRTLKDWIGRNKRSNLRGQQRSFDAFQAEFNDVRPHQSLGQKPPATAFRPYRSFSSRPRAIEYDSNMEVRRVNANGEIKWRGHATFLSEVLIGADVGLLQIGEAIWSISFGAVRIGYLDVLENAAINRRPKVGEES